MKLIERHQAKDLDRERYWDNGDHMQHPCYMATISSVIHEIIHREVTINRVKMDKIPNIAQYFEPNDRYDDVRSKSQSSSMSKLRKKDYIDVATLGLPAIKQVISEQLDVIEADRLIKSLELIDPGMQLTYADVYCAFQAMLEKDMNCCVDSGFVKLDIFDE